MAAQPNTVEDTMSTYILVDYSNLVHRCKHVTATDVETKTGMALHIVLNSLRQLWKRFEADHIVFCLEGRGWRSAFNAGYKKHRRDLEALRTPKEVEDDRFYFTGMQEFANFLRNRTNVTTLQNELAEADDFIAHWIRLHPDDSHIILSGDTDFYQLLRPNVKMYDGVKSWLISTTEVLNENNKPAKIKRTVKSKDKHSGRHSSHTEEIEVKPPVPEYELFKKIVRGDATDNIMGAFPGVREMGTAKRPGIIQAYNDRINKGYDWNQFMLTEWHKLVGVDEDGAPVMKRVRVIDEFRANEQLIDLSKQPEEIKDILSQAINQATQKPVSQVVGVRFIQFTQRMGLTTIGNNPNDYAKMLASPYPKETVSCQSK
jgi:5'-3' exonuclease